MIDTESVLACMAGMAYLCIGFGALKLVAWWFRRPVSSQRQREEMFLAHQTALAHALRRDWRESFVGSIDEFQARDAA